MPELPDLQVISQNLDKLFSKKKLRSFTLKRAGSLKGDAGKITESIEGQRLEKIYRDGKELRFRFSSGPLLGIHLMLHGALRPFSHQNQHTHTLAEWLFENDLGLALTDFQSRATISVSPPEPEAPDALSTRMSATFLKARMASSGAMVKKFLTNQHMLRGIGNAYADEILWDARISPFSICRKVPPEAVEALATSIKKVLESAESQIRKSHPDITSGEIRDFLAIHNPRKEKSPTGYPVLVKKAGGSTYYTEEQTLYQ